MLHAEKPISENSLIQIYETGRFRLRPVDAGDVAELYENLSDPVLMEHYDMAPLRSLEEAEDVLLHWKAAEISRTGCRWAITEPGLDRLIGTIGFHSLNMKHRRCEIGYELSRDFWGQGVMSEVFPHILRHAFEHLELSRVGALVAPANEASIGLLQKFGFEQEGVLRSYMNVNDTHTDMIAFGLLKTAKMKASAPHVEERITLTL